MKTTLLSFILALLSLMTYAQATTSIPNPIFENYLETHDANGNVVDVGQGTSMGDGNNGNGLVFTANISGVTNLNVNGKSIYDMTGIEDFAALEFLDCASNGLLQTLNLFNNTALKELRCFNNDITSLTLPNSTSLTYLSCSNNNLPSLDVSAYINLDILICNNNTSNLNGLDFSSNTILTELLCNNSGVNSLNVSTCTLLQKLQCSDNALSTLDISANTALIEFRCFRNAITTLTLSLSNYTSLTSLNCGDNPLGSLNASRFPNVETLYCYNNNLNTLDVTTNLALDDFDCGENNLEVLDVSNNHQLVYLYCYDNNIGSLNLATKNLLEELSCWSNPLLSSLTLPNVKTVLNYVEAYNMSLSDLNYTGFTQLKYLDIGINNFTSVDVSSLPSLFSLYVNDNQLTSLNIANGDIDSLTNMWCYNNPGLECIQVDDVAKALAKSSPNWQRDVGMNFSLDCALSAEDFNKNDFTFYPNPASHKIYLDLKTKASYNLTNMLGQQVKEGDFNIGKNELNAQSLTKGLYVLNIETENGTLSSKIVKD